MSTAPRRRSLFRPCIDIHDGVVKQIVGGTLSDDTAGSSTKTNHVSTLPPAHFASLYKSHNMLGGHVIKLGPGSANDDAAKEAIAAWPNALEVGGGIRADNAQQWIQLGADKVIVTSYLFPDSKFSEERLKELSEAVGKDHLVVDVSCRRRGDKWIVAMNRWQSLTDLEVNKESLQRLEQYCSEFLIHAADVEGLCQGIDEDLVKALGEWVSIQTTYAGGARHLQDLELVDRLSQGKVDLTFGSALDIFGGNGVTLEELAKWNQDALSAQ
ncbi:Enzyme that catalyzes the fourth step in the histidine pathway [Tilletia horrida]|uniref:1-(5-phosphoribosyl)-5-[(5-phosphoribosylamino)methylideneamino] imidazole-4-carboxamide isomerase n=1 Tax=Tilletia horrida TaxID=155126 RepID=A0AAN6GTF5_9BASI|nr:Enzyme that catalyzes the fourth step in the histidine pathway [Tilletia horrida]KAK0556151.1 Enzyme that catalyzes the fourth step in the histidine pathway [Tilletia horrida]KAK0569077.1 Enzyme that catalyzes the fourth step in the histidine pathway [Tilletia horrida]